MALLIAGSISLLGGLGEPASVTAMCLSPAHGLLSPGRCRRQDMASFDDGPLLSPYGYLYSVFHQSGARGEVIVVDVVVVHGAVGFDVVRIVGIGVRGAQAPVDGGTGHTLV